MFPGYNHAFQMKNLKQKIQWIVAAIIIISLGFYLKNTISASIKHITQVNLIVFALLAIPASIMTYFSSLSLSFLIHPEKAKLSLRNAICSFYLIAQIIKYIPGRIWGLAYQIKKLSSITNTSSAITASINYLLITFFLGFILLGITIKVPGSWLILALGLIVISLWIRYGGVSSYISIFKNKLNRGNHIMPMLGVTMVLTSLCLEWVTYFSIWIGLGYLLTDNIEIEIAITLSMIYVSAWILGSLISIVPNGIGIREGSYVVIGLWLGFDESYLAATALLARLLFTLGEIIPGSLAAIYLKRLNHELF